MVVKRFQTVMVSVEDALSKIVVVHVVVRPSKTAMACAQVLQSRIVVVNVVELL